MKPGTEETIIKVIIKNITVIETTTTVIIIPAQIRIIIHNLNSTQPITN